MFYRAPLCLPYWLLKYLVLVIVLMSTLMVPFSAHSASLGDASVRSTLGQRLDAEIDIASLMATEAESVSVKLAPSELWMNSGIDLGSLQRSLRLSVEKKEGRHSIRITSDLAVNDPFIHLLIELSASGVRTIRQYVLLIDPPATINVPSAVATTTPTNTLTTAANRVSEMLAHHSAKSAESMVPGAFAAAASSEENSLGTLDEHKADPASKDHQHRVKRGETLRSIARQVQPEGVQLEQVMVSLLNRNPDAFSENNLNRLRNGSLLAIPSAEVIRTTDPEKARQTVRFQTADFLRYQRQLAERSVASAGTTTSAPSDPSPKATLQSSGGSVSVRLNEPAPPPIAQDKLTLSSPGGSESASSGASSIEVVEKIASDKALSDANARITELEKNISDIQAVLEIKSRSLAEAQQRTEFAPASAPVPSISQPTSISSITEDVFSVVDLDPLVGMAVTASLLVVVLLWLVQHRKRSAADDIAASPIEPTMSPTVIGEAGGRQIDTSHSVFHSNFVPSVSQIDMNEVDAIAEADVYIAYGRDEQAEEILLDTLRTHPERHTLRVKLLEIYAARNDRQRFGTLAAELRLLTHGQGPDWTRAAQLGQSFEPDNHLYKSVTSTPGMAAVSSPRDANVSSESVSETTRVIDFSLAPTETPITTPSAQASPSSAVPVSMQPIAPSTAMMATTTQGLVNSSVLSTKLELALACREIGDHAGARDLLNEVASARDPELAQRAQALLLQLA